jgi:hypothetical protein
MSNLLVGNAPCSWVTLKNRKTGDSTLKPQKGDASSGAPGAHQAPRTPKPKPRLGAPWAESGI